MSYAQFDLAPNSWELGKHVLTLSALGIFTKLLNIDLSNFEVLGISFGPQNAALIPGFIGLALIYSLAAFMVARMESALFQEENKEAKETRNSIIKNKGAMYLVYLIAPLSLFAYSLPYVLGIFSIVFLWSDSMSVLHSIWVQAVK